MSIEDPIKQKNSKFNSPSHKSSYIEFKNDTEDINIIQINPNNNSQNFQDPMPNTELRFMGQADAEQDLINPPQTSTKKPKTLMTGINKPKGAKGSHAKNFKVKRSFKAARRSMFTKSVFGDLMQKQRERLLAMESQYKTNANDLKYPPCL